MESSQTDASPAPIAELQINRVSASSHARDSRISEGNDMVFFSGFVESDILVNECYNAFPTVLREC
jgi:hypothetical protein